MTRLTPFLPLTVPLMFATVIVGGIAGSRAHEAYEHPPVQTRVAPDWRATPETARKITWKILQSATRPWDDLAAEVATTAASCGTRLITISQSESHGGNGVFVVWCYAD